MKIDAVPPSQNKTILFARRDWSFAVLTGSVAVTHGVPDGTAVLQRLESGSRLEIRITPVEAGEAATFFMRVGEHLAAARRVVAPP